MMKVAKALLLAVTLAAFGNSAFADMYSDADAEEIIMKGEIIESAFPDPHHAKFVIFYRSKLYLCDLYVPAQDLRVRCYSSS